MPRYITHIKQISAAIILSLLLCCCSLSKPCTEQIKTLTLQNEKTIDTYNYQGVKMYVYDTVIIVLRENGDTAKTDHRNYTIKDTEIIQSSDTASYEKNDRIVNNTEYIIRNEMTKSQRMIYNAGLIALSLLLGVIIFKLCKIFSR